MELHYIYKTTNLINGKMYVGQRKLPKNIDLEKDKYIGSGTLLLSAIKKHGKDNFVKEVLEICYSTKEADELEITYFDKLKVLENKDVFYNRSPGGQFWRPEGHAQCVSESMKKYYADEDNILKFRANRNNMTVEEYIVYSNKKEIDDARNKRISELNKKLKAAKKERYKKARQETLELRQEFYRERDSQRNKILWQTKKNDPSFYEAVRKGKEKVDYKKISNKALGNKSKGMAAKESIIYDNLWSLNLSVNKLKCKKCIITYLGLKIKTKEGLVVNVTGICNKLKLEGIDISFDELYAEAKIKYSGKF